MKSKQNFVTGPEIILTNDTSNDIISNDIIKKKYT